MTDALAVDRIPERTSSGKELMGEPYIGLRPYRETERDLFFGRDNDATRLCNKIFASPLTIVYAPSGVGKTSLLVTLVVPDLQAKDSLVVYFDRWTEPDPCAALKLAIVERMQAAGAGSTTTRASLAAVAAAATQASEKPLVLVLDQFESYLIRHAEKLDPFRSELADLIRAGGETHVVFALRQEFLAGLDVFRDQVLSLFRSTFHLHHLDGDEARKAIVQPAERFGGTVEKELVDRLLVDLRTEPSSSGDPSAMHSGGIELPFLQIVCLRLWHDMMEDEEKRQTMALTLDAYVGLGGRERIIREYVKDVVATLPVGQRTDMAKVLDCFAPRSGTKMAYAVPDLRERTKLSDKRIQAVLDPLFNHWVIRERKTGKSRIYELYHDAFIRILRPWVEEQLGRIRRRQWILGIGIPVVALQVIGVLLWMQAQRIQERGSTEGMVKQLKAQLGDTLVSNEKWESNRHRVTAAYDQAAFYLVGKDENRSLKKLTDFMRSERGYLLSFYGARESMAPTDLERGAGLLPRSRAGTAPTDQVQAPNRPATTASPATSARVSEAVDAVVTTLRSQFTPTLGVLFRVDLHLGSDSGAALRREWAIVARHLTDTLGVPVPRNLTFLVDRSLSPDSLRLVAASRMSQAVVSMPVPSPESTYVSEAVLRPRVRNFYFGPYTRNEVGIWPRDRRLPGGPLWRVPRWTAPIWKAAGEPERPRAQVLALAIAERLLRSPELLLTDDVIDNLLARQRFESSARVDYALATAGRDRLRDVFRELIRSGGTLTSTGYLLETVPDHAGETPKALAERIRRHPSMHLDGGIRVARGPLRSRHSSAPEPYAAARTAAAFGADVPVRIYVSTPVFRRIRDEATRTMRTDVSDSLGEIRHALIRSFGISVPDVTFRLDTVLDRDSLRLHAFRIEMLTQSSRDIQTRFGRDTSLAPRWADSTQIVAEMLDGLRSRFSVTRAQWITLDKVNDEWNALPRNQREWIRSRFSHGDLRRLLQLMIAPDSGERDRHASASGTDSLPRATGESISQTPWLLSSLVFWLSANDTRALDTLALRLRATQRARLASGGATAPPSSVASIIARGIGHLESDRVAAAHSAFREALAADARGATDAFLAAYPAAALSRQIARLSAACVLPPRDSVGSGMPTSPELRVDLEDALTEPTRSAIPTERRRRLEACLLGGYVYAQQHKRAGVRFDVIATDTAAPRWEPTAEFRIAMWALQSPDINRKPVRREKARAVMFNAIRRWSDDEADAAAPLLASLCVGPRSLRWCRSMLDSLVELKPASFLLPLHFGHRRAEADDQEGASEALRLFDLATRRFAAKSVAEDIDPDVVRAWRQRVTAWLDWGRVRAGFTLAKHGERHRMPTIAAEMERLAATRDGPTPGEILPALHDAYVFSGQWSRADEVLRREIDQLGLRYVWSNRHFLSLATGQLDSALYLADSALRSNPYDQWTLFLSATTRTVSGQPDANEVARRFLKETNHEYRDYIRLMLYWSLLRRGGEQRAREAHLLLTTRMKEIDTLSWAERLERRDRSVWREMLIGYYANQIPREVFFAPLANAAALRQSPLNDLGYSLDALRCEAWFYDALLQGVTGPADTRRERQIASLDKALAAKYYLYYEHHLAQALRNSLNDTRSPTQLSATAP